MTTSQWPADKVERWPLDRLVPYARNARTHDENQVAQIAASIREWGWTNPVFVDEQGTIIAGMRRPLLNNSDRGQAVYDPFLGSGTTLIAAETIGRVCLAVELSPLYVDVAVRRWQAFTGLPATLLADGRTFDAVAEERVRKVISEQHNAEPQPRPRGAKEKT
ncbi:MAG: hypothetical protein QOI12_2936 [Alphaproteobacteria bacterium]|jgi:hypothetical protein|nr:hypothetical protein [Alphaproteobacteria bacterium]